MSSPTSLKAAPRLTFIFITVTVLVGMTATWTTARFARIADRMIEDVQRRVNLPVYGMNNYLGKPIHVDDLPAALERARAAQAPTS